MLKNVILTVSLLIIFSRCENPIQSAGNYEIQQSKLIWQGQHGETCTAIAASPTGQQLAFIIQKTDTSDTISHSVSLKKTKINRLVIMTLDSLKIRQRFDFVNDSLRSLAWDPEGQRLLVMSSQQALIFNTKANSMTSLTLPFAQYLPSVGWAPLKDYLALLIPNGNKFHQVFYNIVTHNTLELSSNLSPAIKDFCWAFKGQLVAYLVPDSSLIYIFKYHNSALIPKGKFHLFVSTFRWMQSSNSLRNKIGDYALFKSNSSLGLFYFDQKHWKWLPGLPADNIAGFSWASDGQNIFYIFREENGSTNKIIREQIIYANE